jgi:hypothetical protein
MESLVVEHIEEPNWRHWQSKLIDLLPLLIPRPTSGVAWLDVFYVVIIGVLQFNIVPSLGLSWFRVDLLTPWIVAVAIIQPYSLALLTGVVAALLIEGRTMIPAGTMVCTYAVIINVMYIVRDLISWRRQEPWLTALAGGTIWAIAFELFVEAMENAAFTFTWFSALSIISRLACSLAFGLILVHWAQRYLEQELTDA